VGNESIGSTPPLTIDRFALESATNWRLLTDALQTDAESNCGTCLSLLEEAWKGQAFSVIGSMMIRREAHPFSWVHVGNSRTTQGRHHECLRG